MFEYEVVYYFKYGQHSFGKQSHNFHWLFINTLENKDISKIIKDPNCLYVGIECYNNNNKFAIIHMTNEYLNYLKSLDKYGFSCWKYAHRWMVKAKENLRDKQRLNNRVATIGQYEY